MPFQDLFSDENTPFLLGLAAQLIQPTRGGTLGEVLGPGLLTGFGLKLQTDRQKKLSKLYDLQTEAALNKQNATKAEQEALSKIIADRQAHPDSKLSDIMYKYVNEAPSLLDDIFKQQQLEARQEVELSKRNSLLSIAEVLPALTDDPLEKAALSSGVPGFMSAAISSRGARLRAGESAQRSDAKAAQKEFQLDQAIAALPGAGVEQQIDFDPSDLTQAAIDIARQNPSEAGLSRAFGALQKDKELKRKETLREERKAEKAKTKAEAETSKPINIPVKELDTLTVNAFDEIENRLNKAGVDLEFDNREEAEISFKSVIRTLTSRGVDPNVAKNHAISRMYYGKLRGASDKDILNQAVPSAKEIRDYEALRGDPNFKKVQKLFFDKYGYVPDL